jgi:ribA/ribD-fused uncharacterized protein
METINAIYFNGEKNLHGYMSNFYKSDFVDNDGNRFCCSEQYLMYMKAKTFEPNNLILLNKILAETSASKIKQYGREVKNYVDAVWNEIRYGVMVNGLRLKFSQNPQLKQLLINTGDKMLYEASKYDKIWGIGFSPQEAPNINQELFGRNLLGQSLMQVRNEFK